MPQTRKGRQNYPTLEGRGALVPAHLEERFDAAVQRGPLSPPRWRLVATGKAQYEDGNVRLRTVNDLGHTVDIFFTVEQWAYAVDGFALTQLSKDKGCRS
jgi:hypothetical protein